MSGSILDALTRRRLGGAVLVLAGIAVALVVLWPAGDGSGDGAKAPAVRLVSVPELGMAFAYPSSWRRTAQRRVIMLRSPDGSAVMTFASPVGGRQERAVKDALKRTLRRRLAPATIVRDAPGRLGPRRVETFELAGANGPKNRVRVLALVDSTPHRTYAVTLLTSARPSRRRLIEAQRILGTVRFTEPVRPRR